MSDRTREEILAAAKIEHDAAGCGCDPKYLMSCGRMAQAILAQGNPVRCSCGRRLIHPEGDGPAVCVYCRKADCTCFPLHDGELAERLRAEARARDALTGERP